MRESDLKNAVHRYIKLTYPKAFHYHPSDRWISGIPDFLICLNGKFIAIELKVGYGKPTRIQLYVLDKIKEAGGRVAVCKTIGEVKRFMEEVENGR